MMTSETQDATWPLPRFYFSVEGIPGNPTFQEVIGLDTEPRAVQSRTNNMPGGSKEGNVALRKGIFVADAVLWTWLDSIKMKTIARSNIAVSLLDQTGTATYKWHLNNALPIKLTSTDLKSDGNEVAVESLEIAFESMTISLG
jgi:phage tail-like protein